MMIRNILTVCAAVAMGVAGASVASAQGYPQPPGAPTYSAAPAGYPADYQRPAAMDGVPDYDAVDDNGPQGTAALPPPGPVMSPDDPRYGRPESAPVYSDRGPPQGPVMSPDDPRYGRSASAPAYSDGGAPQGPVMSPDDPRYGRPVSGPAYSDRSMPQGPVMSPDDPRYGQPGPSQYPAGSPNAAASLGGSAPGNVPPAPVGADGRPMSVSALPPDDQPEADQGGEKQLAPNLQRQEVSFVTKEPAGTIVVDTGHTYLYYVLGNNRAIRYGVRVGRDGFRWSGTQKISRKAEWPDWHPPPEMIDRQPYLPRFMAGGPGNPLGARAMYLGSTEYRIHGTNQPSTIGHYVSSGCIGMLNEDVSDLFDRVKVGTRVVVLPGSRPADPTTTASAQPVPDANGGPPPQPMTNLPGTQPTSVAPLPAPVTVR